jgi:hypothetical protein
MNQECSNPAADTYPHMTHQRAVEGGYSGTLTVTNAGGPNGGPSMVFVDSDLLSSKLVLTPAQAWDLGFVLMDAARIDGLFGPEL